MKKLVLIVMAIVSMETYAQDQSKPWAIGLGINTTDASQYDFRSLGDLIFNDYVGPFKDTNTFLGKVSVARYLNRSFTVDFVFTYNKLNKEYGESDTLDNWSYISGDLGLRYDLNNLIGKTGWFDPYAKIGGGAVLVDEGDGALILSGGFGFNTWFNDKFGLNFETNLKTSAPFSEIELFKDKGLGDVIGVGSYHFQHSVSVVYKFGGKDTDGDGVNDKDDLCPELPGTKEQFGCPDSDGDGVVDKDDLCPGVKGDLTASGCPDADGDGIADEDDLCPNSKGDASLRGCLDTDRDGIVDEDDLCPNIAGVLTANGCPDSDGDGVADKFDTCPDVAGTIALGGCAESEMMDMNDPNAILSKGESVETIYFKFGSVAITYEDQKKLDKVVAMLEDDSMIAGFFVSGHTDNIGVESINMKVSRKRAESAVEYLVSEGIDRSRLVVLGYGESRPEASNATSTGRAKNRRVEVDIVVVNKK